MDSSAGERLGSETAKDWMVREIIADEQRYSTAVLLLIAEGHRWPIAGAHSPAVISSPFSGVSDVADGTFKLRRRRVI